MSDNEETPDTYGILESIQHQAQTILQANSLFSGITVCCECDAESPTQQATALATDGVCISLYIDSAQLREVQSALLLIDQIPLTVAAIVSHTSNATERGASGWALAAAAALVMHPLTGCTRPLVISGDNLTHTRTGATETSTIVLPTAADLPAA